MIDGARGKSKPITLALDLRQFVREKVRNQVDGLLAYLLYPFGLSNCYLRWKTNTWPDQPKVIILYNVCDSLRLVIDGMHISSAHIS